jgi:hypothetical protein
LVTQSLLLFFRPFGTTVTAQKKEQLAKSEITHLLILMILWTLPVSNKAGINELVQCH